MTVLQKQYSELLQAYVTAGDEQALASISEVGRELVATNIPIEEIAGFQESAVLALPETAGAAFSPVFVQRSSACLTELMIAYSIAFSERSDFVARAREREQAELHNRRLAALGQLVAGVAHELNNLFQPIRGMAELGLRDAEQSGSLHQYFAIVLDCAHQAAGIVRAILDYLRERAPQPHAIALAPALARSLDFARLGVLPGLEIRTSIEEREVWVLADENELTQIMVNLVQNASHALAGSGEVLVRMECHRPQDFVDDGNPAAVGYVLLTVADHGPGMTAGVALRAFDPFFTTKPAGEGTGLGLPIVQQIVRAWGGEVTLETAPYAGTRVKIMLPAIDKGCAHPGHPDVECGR